MKRYRAVIEYDGTAFFGYQIQKAERTVQGEIERVLAKITGTNIRIDGAGRTDSGVHATGQVIAFNSDWVHPTQNLHRALNSLLPEDVVVKQVSMAEPTFHPRFDAWSRSYQYFVLNQPWGTALQRHRVHQVGETVDWLLMNTACVHLLGQKDFASFGKPPQGNSTVRVIHQAIWSAKKTSLRFKITANAFLYRMVRRIVSTLLLVGIGKLSVDEFADIVNACDLQASAPPAPPQGLYLTHVAYRPAGVAAEVGDRL